MLSSYRRTTLDGHSDLIAGGVTGSKALLKPVRQTRSAFGFQLDPHSCWMLSRSMETLPLRMQRAAESGRKVATWLAGNDILPCVVLHPELGGDPGVAAIYARQCTGPGSTFAFVDANDRVLSFRVLNALQLFKLAVIPTRIDQNPCAHARRPMERMRHGWSMRSFQAAQQWATMSS